MNKNFDEIKWPSLSSAELQYLQSSGLKTCSVVFYTCKPNDVLSGLADKMMKMFLPAHSIYGLKQFDNTVQVAQPKIQLHYEGEDIRLRIDESKRPMVGSYLMVASAYIEDSSSEASQGSRAEIESALHRGVAFLSLMHGEFVATERHFHGAINLVDGSASWASPSIYIRQAKGTEHLDQGIAIIIDEERQATFQKNDVAYALIEKAHHEDEGSIKFILLWMALEASMGNGHERREFALKRMKSDSLNDTINEIRKKRERMMHDGKLEEFTLVEYLTTKILIIMSLTHNKALQERLMKYLFTEVAAFRKASC